jgi:hypothetical protein
LVSQRRAQSSVDTGCVPVPTPPDVVPPEDEGLPESSDEELHARTDVATPRKARKARGTQANDERVKMGM